MSLAHARKVSREDFAKFHPGGHLGRSLLPVSQVMRRGDQHCIVTEEMTTLEVVHYYTAAPGRPGAATVVDKTGKVTGIFTDGNLRRLLTQGGEFLSLPIEAVMTKNPKAISPDTLAMDALEVLSTYQIDQVLVVDDLGKPVGLVDIQDVARIFRGVE